MSRPSRGTLVRAAYGAALLLAPDSVVERVAGDDTGRAFSLLRRALGVRHLAQAFALGKTDSRFVTVPGAGADLLHALSLLPFVALDADRRRAYVADFLVEVGFALAGLRAASRE